MLHVAVQLLLGTLPLKYLEYSVEKFNSFPITRRLQQGSITPRFVSAAHVPTKSSG